MRPHLHRLDGCSSMTSQAHLAMSLLFTCQRPARFGAHFPRTTQSSFFGTNTVLQRSRGTQVLSSGTSRAASITWPRQDLNLHQPVSETGVSSGCTTGPDCMCGNACNCKQCGTLLR